MQNPQVSRNAIFWSAQLTLLLLAFILGLMLASTPAKSAGWYPACNPNIPPPCAVQQDPLTAALVSLHHNYDPVVPNGKTSIGFDLQGRLSFFGAYGTRSILPFNVGGAAGPDCTGFRYMSIVGCANAPSGSYQGRPMCKVGVGDPINVLSGNHFEEATDFATQGQYPLRLVRSYNSDLNFVRSRAAGYSAANAPFQSRFGFAWRSQFDRFIVDGSSLSTGSTQIDAMRDDGNPVHFIKSAGVWYIAYWNPSTGAWSTSTDPRKNVDLRLTTDGTYWYIQDQDNTVDKYDMTGKLIQVTYRGGHYQTFTYDGSGNNTVITDSFGRTLTFTYLANGLVDTMTDQTTGITRYTYESRTGFTPPSTGDVSLWALSKVEYPDGKELQYVYEDNTNWINRFALTGIIDENGDRFATWTYDATTGRALSSEHAGGVELTTIAYDDVNNTRTVTNAMGKQSVFHLSTFQGQYQLDSVEGLASTHCAAATVAYQYDSNGFTSQSTSGEGRVNKYVNNSIGQQTSRTEGFGSPVSRTIATTWNSTWREPDRIVEPNITTDFTYDGSGRLTQKKLTDTTAHTAPYSTNGQMRIWDYAYYGNGLLHTVDGPLSGSGDTTTYAYDSSGFVNSVTDVLGHVTTIGSSNGWGLPLSSVDANSITTNCTYDLRGRITGITVNPGVSQAVYGFTYDFAGNLTVVTNPDGSTLTYAYDDAHRVTSVTNNIGESVTYTLDDLNNRTATVVRNASSTITKQESATFDELGRIMANIGASSQTTAYTYDKDNNRVTTTDPRSKVYGYAFDALNRLYQETDPDSFTTVSAFDAQDNAVSVTDARSLVTSYVRNGFGDVIRQTSPDTSVTDFWYDANGVVTKSIDARQVETNYTNDNAGRVLTETFPAASAENVTYGYDATASGNKGVGKLTSVTDQSGSTSFVYNALGQTTTDTRVISGQSYATAYTYDAAGNVLTMTYPSGRIVTYARDALGRISGITTRENSGSSPVTVVSSVTHKPFGPLAGLTFGNGVVLAQGYDQDYQLTGIAAANGGTTIQNLTNGFDPAGNITAITDGLTPARSQTVSYDDLNRVATASGVYGSQSYTYDGVGNRTARTIPAAAETYTYVSAANQIGTVTDAVAPATASGTYLFNAFHQRAQKIAGGVTTHFVFDSAGHLLEEADGSGAAQKQYIWLDDVPVAMVDATGMSPVLYFIHTDQIGTPQKITNGALSVVWDGVFDPFGNPATGASLSVTNLRFPGQYFDNESQLNQNWMRDYSPSIGRYIQSDSIGLDGGINTYTYAGGNPAVYVDPTGEVFFVPALIGAGIGAVSDVAIQLLLNGGNISCIDPNQVILSAGLGAVGGGLGSFTRIGRYRSEFSHWIPTRYIRSLTLSGKNSNPSYIRALDVPVVRNFINSSLNGNYVSASMHALTDPFRYTKGMTAADKLSRPLQQVLRVPAWLGGSVAGSAVGGANSAANVGCGCN